MKINEKIQKATIVFLALFLVLTAGLAYYFYSQTQKAPQNYLESSQSELKDLISRVGELMVLPTDEDPVIATVTDPERLKGQVFFINAKKGDNVLIYYKAKKAILFDPIANKIIEVAPLTIGINESTTPEPTEITPNSSGIIEQ